MIAWSRVAAAFLVAGLAASCSSGQDAGDAAALEERARPQPAANRSREWIEAHPLTEAQQRLLDDCLEAAIGRRDLGAGTGPTANDLAAYERCGEEQGVLDRIMTVEEAGPFDPAEANEELAAEATCLRASGWDSEPEPLDDRGLIFWNYTNLDLNNADELTAWNADRRACGVDVPDGPYADEDHDD